MDGPAAGRGPGIAGGKGRANGWLFDVPEEYGGQGLGRWRDRSSGPNWRVPSPGPAMNILVQSLARSSTTLRGAETLFSRFSREAAAPFCADRARSRWRSAACVPRRCRRRLLRHQWYEAVYHRRGGRRFCPGDRRHRPRKRFVVVYRRSLSIWIAQASNSCGAGNHDE